MSKKRKRKAREASVEPEAFLEPIDITKFGTNDDPCFGKLYDLSTDECKRCGDSELCGVVFAQNLNKKRKKIEKKDNFKDINLEEPQENKALKKWVHEKKAEGLTRAEIIKKAKKTFGSTRETIKKLYKSE